MSLKPFKLANKFRFSLVIVLVLAVLYGPVSGAIGSVNFGAIQVNAFQTGSSTDDTCGLFHMSACIMGAVQWGITSIMDVILSLVGIILWANAAILNYTLNYTLINMSQSLGDIKTLYSSWAAVRDFINIFFIFILLYTAIGTMLGLEGVNWKKTVVRVILVAIFINFSLFMTQALVDASNIVAYGFYEAIPGVANVPSPCTDAGSTNSSSLINMGISGAIKQCLYLTTIYKTPNTSSLAGSNPIADAKNFGGKFLSMVATFIGGIVVTLISAFVLGVIAILFGIRFIILVFLMITSPVAVIGGLLPQMTTYSKKWWGAFTNQLMFAPAMMMMLWLSVRIMSGLQGMVNQNNGFGQIIAAGAASQTTDPSIMGTVFHFAIVISFMLLSIYVAKESGAVGLDFAKKYAGKASFGAAGWVSRNTIGRGAARLSQNEKFREFAGRSAVGQVLYSGTQRAAGASFDLRAAHKELKKTLGEATGKGGYKAQNEEEIKNQLKFANSLNDKGKEGYANRLRTGGWIGQKLDNVPIAGSLYEAMMVSRGDVETADILDLPKIKAQKQIIDNNIESLNGRLFERNATRVTEINTDIEKKKKAIETALTKDVKDSLAGEIATLEAEKESLKDPDIVNQIRLEGLKSKGLGDKISSVEKTNKKFNDKKSIEDMKKAMEDVLGGGDKDKGVKEEKSGGGGKPESKK